MSGLVLRTNGNPIPAQEVIVRPDLSVNPLNTYLDTVYTNSTGWFRDTVPYHVQNAHVYIFSVLDCQGIYREDTIDLNNGNVSPMIQLCMPNPTPFNTAISGTITDFYTGAVVAWKTVYISADVANNPTNKHFNNQTTMGAGIYSDSVYFNPGTNDRFIVWLTDCYGTQITQNIDLNISSVYNFTIYENPPLNADLRGAIATSSPLDSVDSVQIYLIDYNPNTQWLSSIRQQDGGGVGYQYAGYYFNGNPAGEYRVKAALHPLSSIYNNYLPTYTGNVLNWSQADTILAPGPGYYHKDIYLIAGVNPGGPGFIGGLVTQGANKTKSTALVGATVYLLDSNQQPVTWTTTDGNGAYAISNLAYGTYEIIVDALNYVGNSKFVTISPNQPSSTGNELNMNLVVGLEKDHNTLKENIKVFPNPANSIITIDLKESFSGQMKLNLIDGLGKIVFQDILSPYLVNQTVTISTVDFPSGYYLVRIENGIHSKTIPISIIHY